MIIDVCSGVFSDDLMHLIQLQIARLRRMSNWCCCVFRCRILDATLARIAASKVCSCIQVRLMLPNSSPRDVVLTVLAFLL